MTPWNEPSGRVFAHRFSRSPTVSTPEVRTVTIPEKLSAELFGTYDENLRAIEKTSNVRIAARGSEIHVSGARGDVERVERLLAQMVDLLESGYSFRKGDVEIATRLLKDNPEAILTEFFSQGRVKAAPGRAITPKTINQRIYIEAIRSSDLVFSIGPAGTGKTYLAVAMAVAILNEKQVSRIILARPAVEAGEKLGFLPGDMSEKVDPYFRPLYDALFSMMEREKAILLMEKGIIEIAPLAFMRGRTLNDCFVILDEAQNTTSEQMKMFLTRMGQNTKVVVTGDITQIDLPPGSISGLVEAQNVVADIEGIRFVYFDDRDVVRHPLVQSIIKAYESYRNGSSEDGAALKASRRTRHGERR
ncbi:MAG TPA: PhoH family protein [Candidatus Polarisedimenticolia bacterium]|nr:PhoH family protein [Candidatus Polarisedimenticolia bacterium]